MSKASNSIPVLVVTGLVGLLFGLGLSYSEMVNPRRVIGFLDLAGTWDPTLVFVMGGALVVSVIAYQVVRHMQKPVIAEHFALPSKTVLDKELIGGAAIFGIGWGLVGICPGPAIAALSTFDLRAITFVAAMFAGFLTHKFLFR